MVYWVYTASFWEWQDCRGGFCEKRPGTAPHIVPAGSKTDLSLAKSEHISDAGCASVVAFNKK